MHQSQKPASLGFNSFTDTKAAQHPACCFTNAQDSTCFQLHSKVPSLSLQWVCMNRHLFFTKSPSDESCMLCHYSRSEHRLRRGKSVPCNPKMESWLATDPNARLLACCNAICSDQQTRRHHPPLLLLCIVLSQICKPLETTGSSKLSHGWCFHSIYMYIYIYVYTCI